jgi:hypothetical protein
MSELTPSQVVLVADLAKLGLVFWRKVTTVPCRAAALGVHRPHSPLRQGSKRFYPTKLSLSLNSKSSWSATEHETHGARARDLLLPLCPAYASATWAQYGRAGYVIVETSFRVHAYVTSPFQEELLQLFVEVQLRLPNMVGRRAVPRVLPLN